MWVCSWDRLDIIDRNYPSLVAKATDEPLGVDLLLNDEEVPLSEAQLIGIVTNIGVQCLHCPVGEGEREEEEAW